MNRITRDLYRQACREIKDDQQWPDSMLATVLECSSIQLKVFLTGTRPVTLKARMLEKRLIQAIETYLTTYSPSGAVVDIHLTERQPV
jgi:hypothetical protein